MSDCNCLRVPALPLIPPEASLWDFSALRAAAPWLHRSRALLTCFKDKDAASRSQARCDHTALITPEADKLREGAGGSRTAG